MSQLGPTLIGDPKATTTLALARALDADLVPIPVLEPSARDGSWTWAAHLDRWARAMRETTALRDQLVVCTWSPPRPPLPLEDTSEPVWFDVEAQLATWFWAIRWVTARCADGAAVVVVIERPAALDCCGRSAEVVIGEGLIALTRSAAHDAGPRGVRINAVLSEISTAPPRDDLLGLPPMLASFPGDPDNEIAGAVRMLLSSDAAGISGTAIRADGGRSWS